VNEKIEKVTDIELSLITAISALENNLAELDHNISNLLKDRSESKNNRILVEKVIMRLSQLENKLAVIEEYEKKQKDNKFFVQSSSPTKIKSKFGVIRKKKGYEAADFLRVKRIESIEQELRILSKKFSERFEEKNQAEQRIDKENYQPIIRDSYGHSRRLYFSFLFSLIIIFLLIIVANDINIFSY